jgi:hypothetical protein
VVLAGGEQYPLEACSLATFRLDAPTVGKEEGVL